jgi:hypothetical protein
VLKLPEGAPLATLESPEASWPTQPAKEQGYRFVGYRVDEKDRPTFLYEYDGVKIEDYPAAVETEDEPILRREFRIQPAGKDNLWFRAAVGANIRRDGDGYIIDDWRMRVIAETAEPKIRDSNGRKELLLPIQADQTEVIIVQEYTW